MRLLAFFVVRSPDGLQFQHGIPAVAALALFAIVAVAMRNGGLGAGAALETLAGAAFILACRHGDRVWRAVSGHLRKGSSAGGAQALALGALVAVLAGLQLAATWQERSRLASPATGRMADWQAMTRWLREHPQQGPVLVPAEADRAMGMHNFQLNARTPVWVDWKQGAAVMWAPSFHAVWSPRFHAIQRLDDAATLVAYAQANRIPLLLLGGPEGAPACSAGSEEVHRNASFALCRIGQP